MTRLMPGSARARTPAQARGPALVGGLSCAVLVARRAVGLCGRRARRGGSASRDHHHDLGRRVRQWLAPPPDRAADLRASQRLSRRGRGLPHQPAGRQHRPGLGQRPGLCRGGRTGAGHNNAYAGQRGVGCLRVRMRAAALGPGDRPGHQDPGGRPGHPGGAVDHLQRPGWLSELTGQPVPRVCLGRPGHAGWPDGRAAG